MNLTGTLRGKLLVSGFLTAALVLVATIFAWFGYRAIDHAGQNSLRYANQAMLMQRLIKDINQLITSEGAKAVRVRMQESVKVLDANFNSASPENQVEAPELRQKRLAAWAELKGGIEALAAEAKISADNDEVLVKIVQLVARLDGIADEVGALAEKAHAEGERLAEKTVIQVGVLFAVLVAVVVLLFFYLYRSLFRDIGCEPGLAVAVAREIADGRLEVHIDLRPGDSSSLIAEMARMRDKLAANLESIRDAAEENLRVRMALDNVSTGVMIADAERRIIYVNRSARKIIGEIEPELRRQTPEIDAEHLLGAKIENFHSRPAERAGLLDQLAATHTDQLAIGSRHLVLTTNPVFSAEGMRLGSVVEWSDRTGEITVEREVGDIVTAAAQGDLGKRVDLAGKQGFFSALASGLNQLLDNTERSLHATSAALDRLAQGDLTRRIDGENAGIFRQLQDDANATIERLREVVDRIKSAADTISSVVRHIAAGNQDLSTRTEEQASTLNETAHSMEALSGNVRKNAENASRANELTRQSNEIATRGGQTVGRVVATMDEIRGSSKRIADIVGVIDSIAFQTNILALNAAVEAARAGEQGRGFAVVATEVRSLSQRSATAAREIKALIEDSVDKVEAGSALVADAGKTMADVVASFRQVADLMTEIANASREQSVGIEQVTIAVNEMNKVTESNAALVEEAAAAAASLEQQMGHLIEAVDMFKLDPGSGHRRPSAPAAIPAGAPRRQRPLALPSAAAGDEWLEF